MRNFKLIGRAVLDVYENMFILAVCNVIYVALAAIPVTAIITLMNTALLEPELAPGSVVFAVLFGVLFVLLASPPGYAMAVMLHGITNFEASGIRDFVSSMRRYLRRSWRMGFVSLGGTVLLLVNLVFYGSGALGAWGVALIPLFLVLTLFWLLMQMYFFPVAVITEGGPLQVFRNTAIIVVRHPGLTLVTGIVSALLVVASSFLVIPWVIISVALLTAFGTRAVRAAVRRDFNQPDDEPIVDEPLPPITSGDDEPTPLPYYGWRSGRREAGDVTPDETPRDTATKSDG